MSGRAGQGSADPEDRGGVRQPETGMRQRTLTSKDRQRVAALLLFGMRSEGHGAVLTELVLHLLGCASATCTRDAAVR